MAAAIGRQDPFTGETVRLYEEDANRPSVEARAALAKVFERSEIYIEFGVMPEVREPSATYSAEALEVARGFDLLNPDCKDHVRRQVELLRGANPGDGGRQRATKQDVVIKKGKLRRTDKQKIKKTLR